MIAPSLVNLSGLLDDVKCFAFVRQHRWPEGVRCPECNGEAVIGDGSTTRNSTGSANSALPRLAATLQCGMLDAG